MPRDTWYLDPLKFEIIDNDPAKRVVDAVKLPLLPVLLTGLGQVSTIGNYGHHGNGVLPYG